MTTTPTPSNEGKTLKCTFCGNIWIYAGNKKITATCTDCNRHTNIKDSLMMISLIASLAILGTLGTVFADEITLETSFPISGYNCIEDNNGQYPYAECYIQGYSFFIGEDDGISYSWDIVEEKYIPTAQLIKEAKQIYKDSIAEKKPELTRTEKTIINYEKGEITILEQQIISLLEKERSVCFVDVLTIQTYGELEIPVERFIDPLTGEISVQLVRNYISHAFDQKNHPIISQLLREIEQCRGQVALEYMTGPRYDSMVVDDENTNYFKHQDSAIGMKPYTVPRLTDESFQTTQDMAKKAICESALFPSNMKRDYGCFPTVSYGGSITYYQSDAEDAYLNYLKDGDAEQLAKNKQALLEGEPATYGGGYP